jgi:hypothetical protein
MPTPLELQFQWCYEPHGYKNESSVFARKQKELQRNLIQATFKLSIINVKCFPVKTPYTVNSVHCVYITYVICPKSKCTDVYLNVLWRVSCMRELLKRRNLETRTQQ